MLELVVDEGIGVDAAEVLLRGLVGLEAVDAFGGDAPLGGSLELRILCTLFRTRLAPSQQFLPEAHLPILRCLEEPMSDASLKMIVVGYDGTVAAERALARAAELARAFESTIVVADVVAPEPLRTTPGAFGFMPYDIPTVELGTRTSETLWQQHRARIDALFARAGVRHEFAGAIGQPVAEIVEIAQRYDADLIVVGTREPGFLARLLEGSVSQGVARRAHCDVLVVHPPEDTRAA